MRLSFFRHLPVYLCTLVGAVLLFWTPPGSFAASDEALSDTQKKEIKTLVKRYILDHPEVILEAVQRHQALREQADKAHAKAALKTRRPQLVSDPESPVGGNIRGDVTIVEFFDYRCGYCKRVHPTIKKAMSEDKGIRYVYKELPILGPHSITASRAAIAVWRTIPEKYEAFHDAIMSSRGNLGEAQVLEAASKLGIDKNALKKAMAEKAIDIVLAKNSKLAKALKINGTPAFVIGDQLVPGAIDLMTLKKLVAKARGS